MSNAKWFKVAVGLGSNLDDPVAQVQQAFQRLIELPQSRLLVCSDLYQSRPQGPQDQPNFVNAVACFETQLEAGDLLTRLQVFEQQQGKTKQRHWGERLIDLDLLLYGDVIIQQPDLVVPHPFMTERDFVLTPLLKVWPDAHIPGKGLAADWQAKLSQQFLID